MAQDVEQIALLAGIEGDPIEIERLAGAAGIVPGDLLEVTSADALVVHNSAGVIAEKMFALQNTPVSGDIDTAYADGDTVRAGIFHSGQVVNARLAAAALAVVIGDLIESAGDGTVRKAVPIVVLTDNSGGTGTDTIAAITNVANAGSADVGPTADGIAALADKVNEVLAQSPSQNVFAVAREAVDNSGGGTKVRLEIRII